MVSTAGDSRSQAPDDRSDRHEAIAHRTKTVRAAVRDIALALRFLLELAAIAAAGWWGVALGAPGLAVAFADLVVADRLALRATAGRPSRLEAGPERPGQSQVERW
jgi:hypothetical protein